MSEQAKDMKGAKELVEMAQKIYAWQQAQGKSISQMVREFPSLGSDKTYGRLRDGQTDEYDIEAQLMNYRAALALIEAMSDSGDYNKIQIYDDLTAVTEVIRSALECMKSSKTGTNARVVLIEGPSGIGKTKALEVLAGRYGMQVVMFETSDVWDDSPGALLAEILRKISPEAVPISKVDRLDKCVQLLNKKTYCLAIDEAHHLGPRSLNTLKTLVNKTPGQFLLAAIPTLWTRLERSSYMEARQLTTNRLAERVQLHLSERDTVKYLRHVFPDAQENDMLAGAKLICAEADTHGYMAFVRDVANIVRKMDGSASPTAKMFVKGIDIAIKRR